MAKQEQEEIALSLISVLCISDLKNVLNFESAFTSGVLCNECCVDSSRKGMGNP